MRLRRHLPALALLPFLLGGCGGTSAPAAKPSGATAKDEPWVVVATGSITPSPKPSAGRSAKPALPPVSFLPTSAACTMAWPDTVGQVLIPMVVTPGSGSLSVVWPNRYGGNYRLTAVPQDLVTGAQPEPPWQTVTAGSACEASATISGLQSGRAYIVWLDAPDTPRDLDGSRSLYTGRSGIVKPD
jgi:hypothetical protein